MHPSRTRRSHGRPAALAIAAALLVLGAAFGPPDAAAPPCEPDDVGGQPSADLYCMILVPTPDLRAAQAEVALRRAPSPRTPVADDQNGRPTLTSKRPSPIVAYP